MLYWVQSAAIESMESHALGAKQLVVVSTQATLSPKAAIWVSSLGISVFNSSPTILVSITIGSNPAVIIDLKLDFWSILGHRTYFARGLSCLNVNIHNTKLMPVAIGDKKQPAILFTPVIKICLKKNVYVK